MRRSSSPVRLLPIAVLLALTATGCASREEPRYPPALLHADARGGELSYTELVGSSGPHALWGGPAAAVSLDQLRGKVSTASAQPGHFQCLPATNPCLAAVTAPPASLLLVMTPARVSCDVPTAYHVRRTGPHELTVTADIDVQCVAPAAAAPRGAAVLISVPLAQLPAGDLWINAPGADAEPGRTTVTIPAS